MSRTRTTLAVSIGLMLAACGTIGTANAAPDASNNTTSTSATLGNNYAERADVQKFVEQLNAKYDYPKADLLKAFAQAERMDTVAQRHCPPPPGGGYGRRKRSAGAGCELPLRPAGGGRHQLYL